MSAPLTIRDARSEELPAVCTLTLEAYQAYAAIMAPSAWAGLQGAVQSALDSLPAEGVQVIVAEQDGRLLGSVLLYPATAQPYRAAAMNSGEPEIRLLAVSPAARRQGVGETLVRECIRRARAAGASSIGLHTSKSMATARQLYSRLGFLRTPQFDFQPEGAELLEAYRLELGGPEVPDLAAIPDLQT